MHLVSRICIRVVDATYHQTQEAIHLTVIIQERVLEMYIIVMENMDPEVHLVLGSKSLFQ